MDDVPLRPTGILPIPCPTFVMDCEGVLTDHAHAGRMERFNIIRNALNMYNTVHVSATYTLSPSSFASILPSPSLTSFQTFIFSCLSQVLASQPILGVTIQDESTPAPRYERLETIDFRDIVSIIEQNPEGNQDAWLQAGLRTKLDRVEELPVWRVIVAVKESSLSLTAPSGASGGLKFTLAFFGHHAIADGVSCGAFHATFLDALNLHISSPSTLQAQAVVSVPKLPLVRSLEEGTNLPLTIWFILLIAFKEYIYNPIDLQAWTGAPIPKIVPKAPCQVRLRSFLLPPMMVEALVKKCRAEGATVTGLVVALIARKLATMYPDHKHFVAGLPFNFRRFTGHGPRDMGVLVSNLTPLFSSEAKVPRGYISCATGSTAEGKATAEDAQLWESARKTKEFIRNGTASPKNQKVTMLKFAADYSSFFTKKLGGRREAAFEVTNITTVDGGLGGEEGSGKAYFDKAWFCGGLSTYAAPYVVSIVSVKGGSMSVCVTWEEGVISEEEGVEFTEALEQALKGVGGAWDM